MTPLLKVMQAYLHIPNGHGCNPYMIIHTLTLIPLGYFEDLSPLGGGGHFGPPPQISATNGPIDLKIGTVVKQVE